MLVRMRTDTLAGCAGASHVRPRERLVFATAIADDLPVTAGAFLVPPASHRIWKSNGDIIFGVCVMQNVEIEHQSSLQA